MQIFVVNVTSPTENATIFKAGLEELGVLRVMDAGAQPIPGTYPAIVRLLYLVNITLNSCS